VAYATPKIAAVYFKAMSTTAEQQLAARFKFTIVGFYAGMTKTRIQGYVNNIRALNPSIKLASYLVMSEYRDNALTTDTDYALITALNNNGWWARDAVTGAKVAWTSQFSTYITNPTSYTKADASGKRWPDFKAKFDTDNIFGGVTGLDYFYVDQFNEGPLAAGDYLLNGTNQSTTDPVASQAYRAGNMSYVNALRSLNAGKMVIANAASTSSAEYKYQLEGAWMECQIGKSWSYETWAGWGRAWDRYRTEMAETKAPHDVVWSTCGTTADPKLARYGLASAMLHDGYSAFTVANVAEPPWFDEYDAKIGTPSEAPPTAATTSGIWMRRYTNGLVLVNPSATTTLSINVGAGYKRMLGTQDPTVNNGAVESVVTLPPRSGLLMLKV
jgi:hypothetical protein